LPKNIRKHLGVKPKFSGFNVDHLDRKAKSLAKHAHRLADGDSHVVRNLSSLDRKLKEQHPLLNVSLEKKYKTMVHLAKGLGGCDDGDIPMKVITDHLKRSRRKK